MSKPSFGEYLRRHRRGAGMSLQTLADALGVSAPFISCVERGLHKPLQIKHWAALMKALPTVRRGDLQCLYLAEREDLAALHAYLSTAK